MEFVIGMLIGASITYLYLEFALAPIGYEDERGFHYGDKEDA